MGKGLCGSKKTFLFTTYCVAVVHHIYDRFEKRFDYKDFQLFQHETGLAIKNKELYDQLLQNSADQMKQLGINQEPPSFTHVESLLRRRQDKSRSNTATSQEKPQAGPNDESTVESFWQPTQSNKYIDEDTFAYLASFIAILVLTPVAVLWARQTIVYGPPILYEYLHYIEKKQLEEVKQTGKYSEERSTTDFAVLAALLPAYLPLCTLYFLSETPLAYSLLGTREQKKLDDIFCDKTTYDPNVTNLQIVDLRLSHGSVFDPIDITKRVQQASTRPSSHQPYTDQVEALAHYQAALFLSYYMFKAQQQKQTMSPLLSSTITHHFNAAISRETNLKEEMIQNKNRFYELSSSQMK